jgi:hypothetical protein
MPTKESTNLETATNHEPAQEPIQEWAQVDIDAANAALNSVVELKARMTKREVAETGGVAHEANGLVTVRAKPEKRKNAQQRAKERNEERNKDRTEAVEVTAVVPEASGLSTAHPKPEKRLNAKERAKAKYVKAETKDGTTPDTTAKAKSKVAAKAEAKKAKKSKAAADKAA